MKRRRKNITDRPNLVPLLFNSAGERFPLSGHIFTCPFCAADLKISHRDESEHFQQTQTYKCGAVVKISVFYSDRFQYVIAPCPESLGARRKRHKELVKTLLLRPIPGESAPPRSRRPSRASGSRE